MYMWRAMDAAAQCGLRTNPHHGASSFLEKHFYGDLVIGAKKTDDKQEFENQPVVGLHKVDSLWHLHLARPDNVAKCELVKSGLKREIMHYAMPSPRVPYYPGSFIVLLG